MTLSGYVDEFAVFPMLYLRGFLLTPIRMTLNDLECPIHRKVRLADGTLDVLILWLSDLTMSDNE